MRIQKAVVIGAGTMGGGIAALIAGAGIPVTLLDIPAPEGADRNAIVKTLWDRQVKASPAALVSPDAARLVTLGNTDDNFDAVKDADWIIEVILEQLAPKQALMARIEAFRKPDSIVSSNTSGIPIHQIGEGRSADFQSHFLGTHFFNPPRYLKLLEIIPTPDTAPSVVAFMKDFGGRALGKGVVVCKDTPGFIANRIGMYIGQARMVAAIENDYTVEEVDALTGPLIGLPKTATFRLADLVGLDVHTHVLRNQYEALVDDEERPLFRIPAPLQKLIDAKALGNKSGAGFYKTIKKPTGEKEFWVLDLKTGEYAPPGKPRFDLYGQVRDIDDLGARMRAIFEHGAGDRGGEFIISTTLAICAYAGRRVPEIADSIIEIDNAMRWGFNAEAGPFETWDALGVAKATAEMRARDIAVPAWVDEMLAAGHTSFFQRDGTRVIGAWDPVGKTYAPIERPALRLALKELAGTPRELKRNASASVLDLGDGVLCLELHSKGNTLDVSTDEMARTALDLLGGNAYRAMVVANQGKDFCLGANIGLFLMAIASGGIGAIDKAAKSLQDLLMAFRFAPKPVVAAPFQRVLGGGAELSMSGARMVAAMETYMGLVEVGVGIIPAGGGCKELIRRNVSPHVADGSDPVPHLAKVFETIAFARVSESARIARERGFIGESDVIVLNDLDLVGHAKQQAIALAEGGYTPPDPNARSVYAIGQRGKAVLQSAIEHYRWGKYISAHDALIAQKLAHVLCGGDLSVPQWAPEQYLLDLEREAFCSLLGEKKTQERIAFMLKNNKPLRN
ncbi:MAG TPA: 3-hydroxyacyl-CoA dehydrogenase/enoyl-CoA hydratase family protein [Thermoflexales bacterium]|nr:3-hydroxyacyl-CoA dehydrogenase/enoyl-CoA hydratase family protein [Thermoflexales bacterium]